MDDEELIERFAGVTVFQRGSKRAPHKPLLLLIALARLQAGEPRLAPYSELGPQLVELLRRYWSSKNAHAHYPFWRLQNDKLWEIPQREELLEGIAHLQRQGDVPEHVLIEQAAEGGLPDDLYTILEQRPELVNRIAARLLNDNFPPSLSEDILDSIGMPWVVETDHRRPRDPAFRRIVLRAYEYRCAVCGYDGRLGETSLGLEAAHVKWHAASGPDTEDNGIALCSFHHKTFDLGAIGIGPDLRVLVSADVNGRDRVDEWLGRFSGQHLVGPRTGCAPPRREFLDWHFEEVFRGPGRVIE
jgi:putative restriction endonuclease